MISKLVLALGLVLPAAATAQTATQAPPQSAAAAEVRSGAPDSIVAALQAIGLKGEYAPSDTGRPRVRSATSGVNFSVWFYECTDAMSDCETLVFSSGFDLDNGTDPAIVNRWNSESVYTRAYFDDETDPYLDMPVLLSQAMSTAEFRRVVDIWDSEVIDFTDQIGFNR